MKSKVGVFLVAGVALAVLLGAWYFLTGAPSKSKDAIKLQQEWFPYAGYAGEAEAKRIASQDNVTIEVIPGSESVDSIKLVLSGAVDFGVAGADLLIAANAKGADLVCIGTINDISPTCFIVQANSGIKKPSDFTGRKVGILAGTNTERIYALMMKRSNVDRSKVEELPVPFDIQTFVLGQYDVRPAFIYDEPVSLADKGISYEIIKPSEFGVRFLGTVYFTRREVINKNPEKVQLLVDYLVKGWRSAIENPERAINTVADQFDGIDKSRELKALKLGVTYFSGNGDVLVSSDESWQQTISGLEELGEIKSGTIKLEDIRNEDFVTNSIKK